MSIEINIICGECPLYAVGVCRITKKRVDKNNEMCKEGIQSRINNAIGKCSKVYNDNGGKETRGLLLALRKIDKLDNAYKKVLPIEDLQLNIEGIK